MRSPSGHRVETDMLKRQSGFRISSASAFGGINFIEMHLYPYRFRLADRCAHSASGGSWSAAWR